jgi:FKBP-type peptidyl-prolyl cis-trans isomerase 2
MDKAQVGQTVAVHYTGRHDDGTEFDSSRTRNQPLTFEVGTSQVIPGFESAIQEMSVGEIKSIRLEPSEAYGDINPQAIQVMPRTSFPVDFEPEIGGMVQGTSASGQQMVARVEKIEDENITLNFNHVLAGKTLNFDIELLDISSPEE